MLSNIDASADVPNSRPGHIGDRDRFSLLKLRWHLTVGVTEAIPNIEVGAVAARYGVSATAVHRPRILPCCLILRRQIPVRVAEPVTGTEIETVPARRRMRVDAVLGLKHEGFAGARSGDEAAQLDSERDGGKAHEHILRSPNSAGASSGGKMRSRRPSVTAGSYARAPRSRRRGLFFAASSQDEEGLPNDAACTGVFAQRKAEGPAIRVFLGPGRYS
jgi:hypothetical protein